jgi:hypothetical protein
MRRGQHFLYVTVLTLFGFALYLRVFTYNTFGPETPLFYFWSEGRPFREMLRNYTYLDAMWYRPTAFAVPYWILEQLFSWHDLVAWKLAHFLTVLAAAWALYWLVVRPLGAAPLAAFSSALYFLAQPCLYSGVMEVAGFDFIHILFVILSAGWFILSARAAPRASLWYTLLSWLSFLLAVTAKEAALALPGYLLLVSILIVWLDPGGQPRAALLRREALRLVPFFAVLPLYYVLHIARIPPQIFQATGQYRSGANWPVILANCRKFPLWIMRIYAWSDQTLQIHMYQSTALNNAVGLAALLLVLVQWRRIVRANPRGPMVLLLMLGWTCAFLLLPVYSGGYLWHVNLAVIGYCVLFGFAMGAGFDAIGSRPLRGLAVAALGVGALLLGRANLDTELYAGSHATGYRINHSLIDHPPVPAAALGKAPLIYIEDRLGMGPWWYGCYGNLFRFAYLRRELEEVIVPSVAAVSPEARNRWLAHPDAFYFRYDDNYDWHDATAEFREAIAPRQLQAGQSCSAGFPHGGAWPIRIAAGRLSRVNSAGAVWEPDSAYDRGQTYSSPAPVAGTSAPELYQGERFDTGPFEYRICVPNGPYTVRLKFAEIWFDSPGKRIFDVVLNQQKALEHFDIAAAAKGAHRAIDREIPSAVVNGRMVIQFLPVVSSPKISAIEIIPGVHRSSVM